MSCSTFKMDEVDTSYNELSYSVLQSVSAEDRAVIDDYVISQGSNLLDGLVSAECRAVFDGLGTIDDFVANLKDPENSVSYRANQYASLQFGNIEFDIENLATNAVDHCSHIQQASNQEDSRSSDHERKADPPMLVSIGEYENERPSAPDPPLETVSGCGTTMIGSTHLTATPSTSQCEMDTTNESSSTLHIPPTTSNNITELDEQEVDEAMTTVINGLLSQVTPKQVEAMLDPEFIERVLDSLDKEDVLLCRKCQQVFHHIPLFQAHKRTCCSPPRVELQKKMDAAAVDDLANAIWKEAFMGELRKLPNGKKIMSHPEQLQHELGEIWNSCGFDGMVKCRKSFLDAAVAIISHKWRTTALVNELHRKKELQKKKEANFRKRFKSDSDKSEPEIKYELRPSKQKKDQPRGRKSTRVRKPTKNVQKVTETDKAIRELVNELDESGNTPRYHHFTPETPVSEHGDVQRSSPLPTCSVRLTNIRSTVAEESTAMTTPVSDCGVEFTPDLLESDIDIYVREGQTSDVEELAEAVKGFENIDTTNDELLNEHVEEVLSENEFVVGKILDRRLLLAIAKSNPLDEDYEYLVSWEGYRDEDNTWEPYDNLKHCTLKLKEFHDRLRNKALRKRRGKH